MSWTAPHHREIAKECEIAQLMIASEAGGDRSGRQGESKPPPQLLMAFGNLLTSLMGEGGFSALAGRALVLAKTEEPWLSRVKSGTTNLLFEDLESVRKQLGPEEFLHGEILLLANMIELLEEFTGEEFTFHLLKEIWPEIPIHQSAMQQGRRT